MVDVDSDNFQAVLLQVRRYALTLCKLYLQHLEEHTCNAFTD